MSFRDLAIDIIDGRMIAAIITGAPHTVDHLYIDTDETPAWGAIYTGTIIKIDTALDAAIVDLGDDMQGMLPIRDQSLATGQNVTVAISSTAAPPQKMPRLKITDAAPAAAPRAFARMMDDYGVDYFDHIHAGSRAAFDAIVAAQPQLATSKRLRLYKPEGSGEPLFDAMGVTDVLETITDKTIPLPDGGDLVIEQTSAATMIDVNAGAGKNIFTTNRAAVIAALRHIRLRNISGAILIDLISMKSKQERAELLTLATALADADAITTQVHGYTRLGMIEITRKRRSAPYFVTSGSE